MNAFDLRLGNFVTIENKKYWPQVKGCPMMVTGFRLVPKDKSYPESSASIDLQYGDETFSQFDEFIKPIPLTEKWLKDFGFERHDKTPLTYTKCGKTSKGRNTGIIIYKCGNETYGLSAYTDIHEEIIYVHQLQNLYFALTGEDFKVI